MLYFLKQVAQADVGSVGAGNNLTSACSEDLLSILGILKNRVIPLIQIVIIVALVILLIIDFSKAVMAGKEDEIKSAQKLAVKRIVYALVVFFVPIIVNVVIGIVAPSPEASDDYKEVGKKPENALSCWKKASDYNKWG